MSLLFRAQWAIYHKGNFCKSFSAKHSRFQPLWPSSPYTFFPTPNLPIAPHTVAKSGRFLNIEPGPDGEGNAAQLAMTPLN